MVGLVVLGLALRLPNIAASPGWDGDEGYNLDIAWHLARGQAQFFALRYAFVQHPIGFYALLAPLVAWLGRELWVARLLAAVATATAGGLVYLAGPLTGSRRSGVLAGLCLATAPVAVLYGRLAYTYDLLLLWTCLTLVLVLAWDATGERRYLLGAAGAAALGTLTDQEGAALALFVALVALPARRRAAVVLACALAPAALVSLWFFASMPEVALADWGASVLRLSTGTEAIQGAGGGPATALARWFVNYLHLLRVEWWFPAGVAGLFAIRPALARRRALSLAILLALPIFALRELEPFFRTGVPLLAPLSWGAGALLDAGIVVSFRTYSRPGASVRWSAILVTTLMVLLPLGLEIGRSVGALATGFQTSLDWALVTDPAEATAAAGFVNARTAPDDVVITSPHVGWLYRAPVADFFQSIARDGEPVAFYPANIPARRFAFDPSEGHARYAVVDRFWQRWAAESPVVARHLLRIERWTLEWRGSGGTRVYRRPTT